MNLINKIHLKARIIEIVPVSVYDGKTYTQDVIVELDNGQKLAIDDSTKLCKEEFLGEVKLISILIYVYSLIEKTDITELKIIPASVNHSSYQGPYAYIYGYVEEIIKSASEIKWIGIPTLILNVGIGKLFIFLDNNHINIFSKGDYIKLEGARLDLKAIEQAE